MDTNLINYDVYNMSKKELMKYSLIGFLGMFILGYLFYNKILFAIIMGMIGLLYPKYKENDLKNKRKKELKLQFKEGIYAISSSLSAGKSIEQCFQIVLNDLKIIYSEDAPIIKEFEIIVRKINMNETVENAIYDLALRSNIDDITNFSNVFITTKRTGGDLIKIIKYTTNIINEKIEVENEIQVLITQKKYEYRILMLLVPLIIIYLQTISPQYLQVVLFNYWEHYNDNRLNIIWN
jgi:tight adherence protein B